MADNNLPDPNTAPNGNAPQPTPPTPNTPPAATPSEPASKPADAPAGNPTLTLSDDQKNYLKGQGLTDADLAAPDALAKIISHAQSSQKTAADIKNQLDKVTSAVNPQPATPVNPLVNPAPSSQPRPDGTPTNPSASNAGLDPVTAFTLSNQLAQNFSHLREDLTNGKFYQDMQTMGLPLHNPDGSVNLTGMLTYGGMVNGQRELEAKLEAAGKPGEGAIPDANPSTPTQPADDAPMTKQMAQNIALHVARGNTHPRGDEAKQFLQKNVGAK